MTESTQRKMNPEIKDKWVEALRSGQYKQCDRTLMRQDEYGNRTFCCLGVLTDLYLQENNMQWNFNDVNGVPFNGKEVLTEQVIVWARFPDRIDTNAPSVQYEGGSTLLTTMNDDGVTFSDIADIIEEQF
jgi:hypothetical protein